MTNEVHDIVRERYAAAASHAATGTGACCGRTVADGMHSVIVKATKPVDAAPSVSMTRSDLPEATSGCCGGDGCC